MTVPSSPVDICNIAIDLIGDSYITSITTPETAGEEIMSRNYDNIRQATLREFIWPFAKKTVVLAKSGDDPISRRAEFLLPADFIRLLEVFRGAHTRQYAQYEIEGTSIFTRSQGNALTLKYIFDAIDVPTFDPCFIQIVGIRLAMRCAQKFTLKPSLTKMLQEELRKEMMKAVSISSQEAKPRVIERSSAMAARQGWLTFPTGYPNPQFLYPGP